MREWWKAVRQEGLNVDNLLWTRRLSSHCRMSSCVVWFVFENLFAWDVDLIDGHGLRKGILYINQCNSFLGIKLRMNHIKASRYQDYGHSIFILPTHSSKLLPSTPSTSRFIAIHIHTDTNKSTLLQRYNIKSSKRTDFCQTLPPIPVSLVTP